MWVRLPPRAPFSSMFMRVFERDLKSCFFRLGPKWGHFYLSLTYQSAACDCLVLPYNWFIVEKALLKDKRELRGLSTYSALNASSQTTHCRFVSFLVACRAGQTLCRVRVVLALKCKLKEMRHEN